MRLHLILAYRYLLGRRLRSGLTTLAVAFGVMVVFGMDVTLPAMLRAFQANMLAASGQVDLTVTQETGASFTPAVLEQLRSLAGIRDAAPYLKRVIHLPANFVDQNPDIPDVVESLSIVGLEPAAAQTLHHYPVAVGRFLQPGDSSQAVISSGLAEHLRLRPGRTLTLPSSQGMVSLTVVGVVAAPTVPGPEELLLPLSEAQRVFGQPGRINVIEADFTTADPAGRASIEAAVRAQLGPAYRLGALPSGTELLTSIQVGQQAMGLFGTMSLFMGGFIIFNTFRTVVAERRRDLAMLRTVGATRGTLLGLILVEGVIQGVLGSFLGMVLGYLGALTLIHEVEEVALQFVHLRMGRPVVSWQGAAFILTLGTTMTLLAGLWPAWSASRVTPLEGLRPSSPQELKPWRFPRGAWIGLGCIGLALVGLWNGKAWAVGSGALLFLLGLVLTAPILIRPVSRLMGGLMSATFATDGTGALASGNMSRNPSRAVVTASATMIGLAVVVAVSGLLTSVEGTFQGALKRSLGSDYLLVPPAVGVWAGDVGADGGLVARLKATPGVGAVSSIRYAESAIEGNPVSLLGIDPEAFPKVAALDFDAGDARTAFAKLAAGPALIANGPLAVRLQAKMGDRVTLSTPGGEQVYQLAGIAHDYLNAKIPTAYLSQRQLEVDFHRNDDVFIQLNLAHGADPAAVKSGLESIVAAYPQFRLVSGRAYLESNLALLDKALVVYYALFFALAVPSLIALLNTLAIGVIERTREIGTLRAIGATRRQVQRMVLAESLLLAALGTALGLLAGLYLGSLLTTAMSINGFPVMYHFPVSGLLAALAVGLLVGVVAALVPARQAARLEIVRALRHE